MRGYDATSGRTIGVGAIFDSNGKYINGTADYFRLHREYDRTGIRDFNNLNADCNYLVRVGTLVIDTVTQGVFVSDAEIKSKLPTPEVWLEELEKLDPAESVANFKTFADPLLSTSMKFIFGSCRYPGLIDSSSKSDQIFGSILGRFKFEPPPAMLMMIGDQIYADKFNRALPVGRADSPSEFHDRYLTAFTSPNMRALLRQAPTYMILDDHEIEDNWNKEQIKNGKRELFQYAITAYMSYQWVHSPRNYDVNNELSTDSSGRKFFYSFECNGYPFFVMDSRTQRIKTSNLEDNHLLGYPTKPTAPEYKGQVDIVSEWLIEQQKLLGNKPKFLVSPSVFVPNNVETAGDSSQALFNKLKDDSWAAFPATRRQLLQTIVNHKIQNVVFLCGDVHCSHIAELSFKHIAYGKLPIKSYSITSSAFYWPWPFADGDPLSFVHDSEKENDDFRVNEEILMSYKANHFSQDDNFTEVSINPASIVIKNFNRDGLLIGDSVELSIN
jgi:alkaline phosphatase D